MTLSVKAAEQYMTMGSRKIAQSAGQFVGGTVAINNMIASLYTSLAQGAPFGDFVELPAAEECFSNSGSPATSCEPFSQAAKSIACGHLSASEQDFHERLVAQLQKDANDIRKTCAIVRDPSAPRVVTYKEGEELWATIRGICCG